MTTNPFKNFYPMLLKVDTGGTVHHFINRSMVTLEDDGNQSLNDHLANLEAPDPTGGQWRTITLAPATPTEFTLDLNDGGILFAVQFNERILPGKVIAEKMAIEVVKLQQLTGQAKVSKQEFAQLRDQVEFEWLPKSHIRRTVVYILINANDQALVFTSSAKKADDAILVLLHYLNDLAGATITASYVETETPIDGWLTAMAVDRQKGKFWMGDAAALKNEKKVIRIKGDEMELVSDLITNEYYQVTDLALTQFNNDEPKLSFMLNDKMSFRKCVIPDTILASSTDKGDDGKVAFYSMAYIVARYYRDMLKAVITELGGIQSPQAPSVVSTPAAEDDEL